MPRVGFDPADALTRDAILCLAPVGVARAVSGGVAVATKQRYL